MLGYSPKENFYTAFKAYGNQYPKMQAWSYMKSVLIIIP